MKTHRFSDTSPHKMDAFVEPVDMSIAGTEILGKYTVVRKLGQGGMGVVVAARHNELGGLFAIKFLLPGVEADQHTMGRFLREAKASSRLRGEHVVRVHDVGRLENGAPYMVMEYLEGQNLKSIVRQGPLAIEDAVTYLLQICDGIAEAHAAGIVHRDLKPANLYLTTRPNGTPCIKVLDFGISKLVSGDVTDLTGNHMIGSLRYMAPEQILSSRGVDARADIWAIGLIACEFFTAKLPFYGQTHFDIVTSIMESEPEPPSVWRRDLPLSIEGIVLRCLRKNPNERFQSAQELSEALRTAARILTKNASAVNEGLSSISGSTTTRSLHDHEQPGLELDETDNTPTICQRRSIVPSVTRAAFITLGMGVAIAFAVVRVLNLSRVGERNGASGQHEASFASSVPSASSAPPVAPPPPTSEGKTSEPSNDSQPTPTGSAPLLRPTPSGSSSSGPAKPPTSPNNRKQMGIFVKD